MGQWFLSDTYGDEHGSSSISLFAVHIDADYARTLLARIWKLNELRADDYRVRYLECWDTAGHWLGADPSSDDFAEAHEDCMEQLRNATGIGGSLLGDGDPIAIENDTSPAAVILSDRDTVDSLERRTECDHVVIDDDRVWWWATPRGMQAIAAGEVAGSFRPESHAVQS